MSGDRSSPQAPDLREGADMTMTPEPSTSPRRGGETRTLINDDDNRTMQRKMIDLKHEQARIFYVQSTPGHLLASLNGFIVKKAITYHIGPHHSCTRLRSGTLRIEVQSSDQARTLWKVSTIHDVPVTVTIPFASNTCRGVVSHFDFARMSEDEIVEEMADLKVVACRKFYRQDRNTHTRVPSNTVCLTFATTDLPDSIMVGYELRNVRPFIPRPIRCNKCQAYGHTERSCHAKNPVCLRCANNTHGIADCTASVPKCAACGGAHQASDRTCPVWDKECDIAKVRTLQRLSYREARSKVEEVVEATPRPGVSYSLATQSTANRTEAVVQTPTAPVRSHKGVDTRMESGLGSQVSYVTPTRQIDWDSAEFQIGKDLFEASEQDTTTTQTNTTDTTTPTQTCPPTADNSPRPEPSLQNNTYNNTPGRRGENTVNMKDLSQTPTQTPPNTHRKPQPYAKVAQQDTQITRIPVNTQRRASFQSPTRESMEIHHQHKRGGSPNTSPKPARSKKPNRGNKNTDQSS